jgi:hypothetical protein
VADQAYGRNVGGGQKNEDSKACGWFGMAERCYVIYGQVAQVGAGSLHVTLSAVFSHSVHLPTI